MIEFDVIFQGKLVAKVTWGKGEFEISPDKDQEQFGDWLKATLGKEQEWYTDDSGFVMLSGGHPIGFQRTLLTLPSIMDGLDVEGDWEKFWSEVDEFEVRYKKPDELVELPSDAVS